MCTYATKSSGSELVTHVMTDYETNLIEGGLQDERVCGGSGWVTVQFCPAIFAVQYGGVFRMKK